MTETGILGIAAYVPAGRLKRAAIHAAQSWAAPGLKGLARGFRSFANWDEDSLTMAVEAGLACLRWGTGPEPRVERLVFATTSAPFEDRSNAGVIAEALGLGEALFTGDAGGSLRAATSGLIEALENARRTTLLVAADRRPAKPASAQEMSYGDGAAAVILGPGAGLARYLGGASLAVDFVDHYRTTESETDYAVEERWVRDEGLAKSLPRAIEAALKAAGIEASAITHVVAPMSAKMVAKGLAAAGISSDRLTDTLHGDIGDTGAAHPLLMLHHALTAAKPGEIILLLGLGQGVDGLVFEVTGAITGWQARQRPHARVEDDNYIRFLSFTGNLKIDWGIRAERDNRTALSTFYRKHQAVTGFVGGRCTACGTPQFPKSRVCVDCGAVDAQEPYRFSGQPARIKTFTEDWQAATPSPPLAYGNIAFEAGGNLFMELTDCPPGILGVGMRVRMVFRVKDFDERRGFRRYFWKAAPVAGIE